MVPQCPHIHKEVVCISFGAWGHKGIKTLMAENMNAVEFDGTNTRTPSTLVVFWCPGTAILGVAIIGGAVASEKIDENHESHDTWRASWRASGTGINWRSKSHLHGGPHGGPRALASTGGLSPIYLPVPRLRDH